MTTKPSYKELEQRIKTLEETAKGEWIRMAVDASSDAIGMSTADGHHFFQNKSFDRMFGYTLEEVSRLHPRSLYGNEHVAKEVFKTIMAGSSWHGEIEMVAKNGRRFPVLLRADAIKNENGDVIGLIGVYTDITKSKRAEEALQFEREQLLSIFDSIDEIIYVSDTDTYEILYANKTLKDAFQKDIIGRTCYREFQGFDSPCHFCTNDIIRKQKYAPYNWEYHNPVLNRDYAIVDRIIKWPDGRDVRFELAIDITERKRTEEALRESEERLHRFSDAAFDAIIIHEEGILISANDQYYEMFGYEPEELMGKQAIPLTVAPEARESAGKKIAAGDLGPYESIGLKKDGTKFPIEIRVREWEYEGRKVRVAAIMDITERKHAEEALKESEEKYKSIFELAPTPIVMLDSDGTIVDINPSHVSQIGGGKVTREDYIGMNVLTHPSVVKAGLSEMYKQVLEGKPIDEEDLHYPSVTRGPQGYFNVRGVPLRKDEEVIGAIVIHDDITERKQAEEKLQRYNQRLMILHDIDRDIAVARSPEAIADTVLKYIRRLIPYWMASVALYEPDTDEVVVLATEAIGDTAMRPGMRVPTPVGWVVQMLTEHYHFVEDTYTLSEPISPAVRLAKSEGTRSYLSASLVAEGNLIGALILASKAPAAFTSEHIEIASEVSDQLAIAIHQARMKEKIERHTLELQEKVDKRTAELQDINAELKAFTYSVSHDLKAPLRGIDGYSRLLLQDYTDKLDEEGQTFLHTIRSASQQMNQLIDDLLDYSRLERRAMRIGKLNPQSLVEMVIAERANELQEHQVTLSVDIPCETLTAEAEGLVVALRNLLENALKFSRDIPTPHIEIGGRETDQTCILWVRDNGIGFDMKYHDRIFEIFQRLHRSEDYPGTGVGLAIVYKVMQRMGGRVWGDSTPGCGATFYLEVPK